MRETPRTLALRGVAYGISMNKKERTCNVSAHAEPTIDLLYRGELTFPPVSLPMSSLNALANICVLS
jgi:hypothetical protein